MYVINYNIDAYIYLLMFAWKVSVQNNNNNIIEKKSRFGSVNDDDKTRDVLNRFGSRLV